MEKTPSLLHLIIAYPVVLLDEFIVREGVYDYKYLVLTINNAYEA